MAWITQAIASKLGIGLGLELASQLYHFLFLEKPPSDMVSYDRLVRDEAAGKLREAKNEVQTALGTADHKTMEEFKNRLFIISHQLNQIQGKIKFSDPLPAPLGKLDEEGIKYTNLVMLCECFAVLEDTRKIADIIDPDTRENIKGLMETVKARMRQIERILDIRKMAIKIQDRKLLQTLGEINPEVYDNIRGLATIIFSADELKSPRFFKGKYYEKLRGRVLNLADELCRERGPILGLSELCVEFNKRSPSAEASHENIEKAVGSLCNFGLLGLETSENGFKILKLKPLKFTSSYQEVIMMVQRDRKLLKNGVTKEEVIQRLKMSPELTSRVLEDLCKDDIAWKHGTKYYFPGLSEAAYTVKKQSIYVS